MQTMTDMPSLADANGRPLKLRGVIALRVHLGRHPYLVTFFVLDHLACNKLLGTGFLNRHVRGILCVEGNILLRRGVIPILNHVPNPEALTELEEVRAKEKKTNDSEEATSNEYDVRTEPLFV